MRVPVAHVARLLSILLLLVVTSTVARADGADGVGGAAGVPEGGPEIWRFTDGEDERRIDVSEMPVYVRRALVERLLAQGFVRRDPEEPAPPGRDLAADVRELVRNQGRFPGCAEPTRPARRTLLGRALSALAVRPSRLLGALVRPAGNHWRMVAPGKGTVASAVGLRPGDALLRLNGRSPDRGLLRRWASAPATGGKLSLRIRRREGRSELILELGLEFVPAGD